MKVEATVFFVLTVAAFAATTGRAAAQGNALALALCRKVPDDQERLKCYDAALDVLLGEKTAKPDVADEAGCMADRGSKIPSR